MLHKKTDHLYGDPLFLYATGDVRTPVPELPKAVEGGAIRVVPQWGIRRRRKRGERVNRSKQRVEASAIPAAPTEIAEGREKRPWRTKYVQIATMLRFSWGAQKSLI